MGPWSIYIKCLWFWLTHIYRLKATGGYICGCRRPSKANFSRSTKDQSLVFCYLFYRPIPTTPLRLENDVQPRDMCRISGWPPTVRSPAISSGSLSVSYIISCCGWRSHRCTSHRSWIQFISHARGPDRVSHITEYFHQPVLRHGLLQFTLQQCGKSSLPKSLPVRTSLRASFTPSILHSFAPSLLRSFAPLTACSIELLLCYLPRNTALQLLPTFTIQLNFLILLTVPFVVEGMMRIERTGGRFSNSLFTSHLDRSYNPPEYVSLIQNSRKDWSDFLYIWPSRQPPTWQIVRPHRAYILTQHTRSHCGVPSITILLVLEWQMYQLT